MVTSLCISQPVTVAAVIGRRWLVHAIVVHVVLPPGETVEWVAPHGPRLWGVSDAFNVNDPGHAARMARPLATDDICCWYTKRSEAEAYARQCEAAESPSWSHWTCSVCGLKHLLTTAGLYCHGCLAMACRTCERGMRSHRCPEEASRW